MRRSMDVSVVLVHYGRLEPTIEMVESVSAWASETIVVANDGAPNPGRAQTFWAQMDCSGSRILATGVPAILRRVGLKPIR